MISLPPLPNPPSETPSDTSPAAPPAVPAATLPGVPDPPPLVPPAPYAFGRHGVALGEVAALISAIAAVVGVLTGTMMGWQRPGAIPPVRSAAGAAVRPVRTSSSATAPLGVPAPTAAVPRDRPPPAAPTTAPAPAPSIGAVPGAYAGAWQEDDLRDGGALQRIVIRAGRAGERAAVFLDVTADDVCRWRAALRPADGALAVSGADPPSACAAARPGTLRLRGDELRWTADGVTVTLHRAADPVAAVPPAYLGSWLALGQDDSDSAVRMTIGQGSVGDAVATFEWDGEARHCEGTSLLVSMDASGIGLGPQRATDSEAEGGCASWPTRILFAPDGPVMRAEWAGPERSPLLRSFGFVRTV